MIIEINQFLSSGRPLPGSSKVAWTNKDEYEHLFVRFCNDDNFFDKCKKFEEAAIKIIEKRMKEK